MSLKIKRDITLTYIEELNQLVENSDSKINVSLPKKNTRSSFAVIPSFIQFFATAIRNNLFSSVIFPYSSEEDLSNYIREEFVYPLTVLSWNLEIIDESGGGI